MADDKKKRNKKKNGGGGKKKMTTEQTEAFKSVSVWLFVGSSSPPLSASSSLDDFAVTINGGSLRCGSKLVFELHSHSNRSVRFLSPSKVMEKANNNGGESSFFNTVALKKLVFAPETASDAEFVSQFATMGSLHDILHGRKGVQGAQPGPTLDWTTRVKIAVAAARGFEYLHEKLQPPVETSVQGGGLNILDYQRQFESNIMKKSA